MSLKELLSGASPDPQAVAACLDAMGLDEQVAACRGLSVREVHKVWSMAESGPTIDLDFIVPADTPEGQPVIHFGVNTLPASRNFEKRFVRAPGRDDQLWGYNHQPLAFLTGPGYFVVGPPGTDGEDALFIDYRSVPDGLVAGWPPVRDNNGLIGRLVYGGMKDTMRRVSERVSVGRAYLGAKDRKASFILVRGDA